MKIIHTSDFHLGSKLTANLGTEKAKVRKTEINSNFSRLFSDAEKRGVELIIVAGDLFDTERLSDSLFESVKNTIVSHPDIHVVYVVGNHEKSVFSDRLDKPIDNLSIFSDSAWQGFRLKDVVVSGTCLSELNRGIVAKTLSLSKEDYNVVVLHGALSMSKNAENAEIIALNELRDKNIDYLALGHYHSFSTGKIDGRGAYAYSGCPEGRGFDETGEKGYVFLDTEKGGEPEFVPFCKRKLFEKTVDVSNACSWEDVKKKITESLAGVSENDMVRIVVKGNVSSDKILFFFDELETELGRDYFFVKIKDDTLSIPSDAKLTEGNGIAGEFTRLVLEDGSLTEKQKSDVLQMGLKALRGEEIS